MFYHDAVRQKLSKSANVLQSYSKYKSGTFFIDTTRQQPKHTTAATADRLSSLARGLLPRVSSGVYKKPTQFPGRME